MRIKSGVWYWLAVASGAVGMLYALGFAGSIEALGVISDTDFITAMVLLLLALFFARLGDHAAERERRAAAGTSTAATPRTEGRSTGRSGGTAKNQAHEKAPDGHGPVRNQVNHGQRAAVERLFQTQQCSLLLRCQPQSFQAMLA